MINKKTSGEPLFHVSKRQEITKLKATLYTLAAVALSLILGALFCGLVSGNNPVFFFTYLIEGVFKTPRRFWTALRDMALLLGVAMALLPAFKMKFWNLGGNGQILMGALATIICMKFLGGKIPNGWVNLLMIITSIAAGIIWALIPAISLPSSSSIIFATRLTSPFFGFFAASAACCTCGHWGGSGSCSTVSPET